MRVCYALPLTSHSMTIVCQEWRKPRNKSAYVEHNRHPERALKLAFTRLMSEDWLRQNGARPTSNNAHKMERAFRDSPTTGPCRRLIQAVGYKANYAYHQIPTNDI
jgi:hypothetical protein